MCVPGQRTPSTERPARFKADAVLMSLLMRSVTRGRHHRAYTLIEVIAATTMFVFVVTLLAGTTATVLSSRAALRGAVSIDQRLGSLLDQVSSNSFETLLADRFTPPDLCEGDAISTGSLSRSCIQSAGQEVTVSYVLTPGPDSAGDGTGPLDAADYVTVMLTATRSNGTIATRTLKVQAPSPGFRQSYGLVRVALTGNYEDLSTPVMLFQGPSFTTPVAAVRPAGKNTVMLRAPLTACTNASPCRVGLSNTYTESMSHQSAVSSTNVILNDTRASNVELRVYKTGTLSLTIDATNSTSLRHVTSDSSPQASSVCVWLKFNDPDEKVVPACNSSDSGARITLSSYTDPTTSALTPLPTDTPITLYADKPGATVCPTVPDMQIFNGSAWVAAGSVPSCSSWTWGRPSTLLFPSSTTPSLSLPATLRIPSGGTLSGVLLFNTSQDVSALPASGYLLQPTFASPRSSALCPTVENVCAPTWLKSASAQSAEVSCAAGTLCNSPGPSAPAMVSVTSGGSFATTSLWPYAFNTATGTTLSFRTYFQDNQSQNISVVVSNLPTGTLQLCNPTCTNVASAPTTASASLATAPQPGAFSYLEWRFTPSSATASYLGLTLSDGSSTRSQSVLFAPSAAATAAVAVLPTSLSVAQNASGPLYAMYFNAAGQAASTSPMYASVLPSGVTSAPVASVAPGWQAQTLTISSATAQTSALSFPNSNYAGSIKVTQRPSTITLSGASLTLAQGGSVASTNTALVTDYAGQVIASHPVSFFFTATDTPWRGVYQDAPVCITSGAGTCTATEVKASLAALSGTGTITASAGSSSADKSVTVSQTPKIALAGATTVPQGGSAPVVITLYDGSSSPIAAAVVTITLPTGLTAATTSATTDSSGAATFNVTAASSSPSGLRLISTVSAGVAMSFNLTVSPVPAQLYSPTASITLTRGTSSQLSVTARDPQGAPVPGASIAVSCTNSVVQTSSPVGATADGTAYVTFYAPVTASVGSSTCSLSTGTATPFIVTVVLE